jgi:hypothetical protein
MTLRRTADNVGGQDRRQFALLTGQWNFPALLQRIVERTRSAGNHMHAGPGALTRPEATAAVAFHGP